MSQAPLDAFFDRKKQTPARRTVPRSAKRKNQTVDDDATPRPAKKKAKEKASDVALEDMNEASSSKLPQQSSKAKGKSRARTTYGLQTPHSIIAASPVATSSKTKRKIRPDPFPLLTPPTLPARSRRTGRQGDAAATHTLPSATTNALKGVNSKRTTPSLIRSSPPMLLTTRTTTVPNSPIEITSSSSDNLISPQSNERALLSRIPIPIEPIELTSSEDEENPFLDKRTSSHWPPHSPAPGAKSRLSPLSPLTESDTSTPPHAFRMPAVPLAALSPRLASPDIVPLSEADSYSAMHSPRRSPRAQSSTLEQQNTLTRPHSQLPSQLPSSKRSVSPMILSPRSQRFVPSSQSQAHPVLKNLSPRRRSGNRGQRTVESSQWGERELRMPDSQQKSKVPSSKNESESSPLRLPTFHSPLRHVPTTPPRKALISSSSRHSKSPHSSTIGNSRAQSEIPNRAPSTTPSRHALISRSSLPFPPTSAIDDSQTQPETTPSKSQRKFTPSPRPRRVASPHRSAPLITRYASQLPESSQTVPETTPPKSPRYLSDLETSVQPETPSRSSTRNRELSSASLTPAVSRMPTFPPSSAPVSSASAPRRETDSQLSPPRAGTSRSAHRFSQRVSDDLDDIDDDDDVDDVLPGWVRQKMRDGTLPELDLGTQMSSASSVPSAVKDFLGMLDHEHSFDLNSQTI